MLDKKLEKRYSKLYEKLVPEEGKAETVEGEMLRAISKIGYRYFNDGDYFWDGYGAETAGPAHAYLVTKCPLQEKLSPILREVRDKEYEMVINLAVEVIVNYIKGRSGQTEKNSIDMLEVKSLYKNYNVDDEENYD
jgi:hypothetical protein